MEREQDPSVDEGESPRTEDVAAESAHIRSEPSPPIGNEPSTGDEEVDTAVERLAELPSRPVAEHVDVLDDVHGRLQHVLDDLDRG